MDNVEEIRSKIALAEELINSGSLKKARDILAPLVESSNADALFLYSTFSISKDESEEDFERRSLDMLIKAAELGHAKANYALAVRYDFGDGVACNKEHAAQLFKKSAEGGYSKAKLNYSLDLIYGTHGIAQDKFLGVKLLKAAAEEGVEGALEELSSL